MADRERLEDLRTRAMLAVGERAIERALADPSGSDEGRDVPDAERRDGKKRAWKPIVAGVLVLFVVIGVVGMLVTYWQWFLLAGLVGLAALYGFWRIKRRLSERRARVRIAPAKVEAHADRFEPSVERRETEASERDVGAQAEAEATNEQQAVEDELAALKARIRSNRG